MPPPTAAPTSQASIALVEDESILREELCFQLTHLGFTVEGFADAGQLYRRLAVHHFAVVILDIGLKGEDGLSVCHYLRAHDKQLGIIFVTARALRDDRLTGLEAGADAYLSKPVDIDELALILRRLTERKQSPAVTANPQANANFGADEVPGWRLDSTGDHLLTPAGIAVRLTVNEIRVLQALLHQPGTVTPCTRLAAALGLMPEEYDKHRLEVIISRLRDKILRETGLALPLLTRRGMGYLLQTQTTPPHLP